MPEDPIDRVITYLQANDSYEDGLEGQLARELVEYKSRIKTAIYDAIYALHRSADFAGNIGDGDEEINAPWNLGGYGFETGTVLRNLADELDGKSRRGGDAHVDENKQETSVDAAEETKGREDAG